MNKMRIGLVGGLALVLGVLVNWERPANSADVIVATNVVNSSVQTVRNWTPEVLLRKDGENWVAFVSGYEVRRFMPGKALLPPVKPIQVAVPYVKDLPGWDQFRKAVMQAANEIRNAQMATDPVQPAEVVE
jgi:hypothetical protein